MSHRLNSSPVWVVALLVVGVLVGGQRAASAESAEQAAVAPPWEVADEWPVWQEVSLGHDDFAQPTNRPPRISASPDAQPHESQLLYSMSALGTTPGLGVGSLGGRLIYLEIVFPTFDFHYLHTVSEVLDFEFRGWTIGILSWIDVGVRLAARSEGVSFGFRANVMGAVALIVGSDSAFGGVFGLVPGVMVSFGDRDAQVTLGLDMPVPMLLTAAVSSEFGTATGAVVMLRPNAALEFPIGERSNLYFLFTLLVTAEDTDFPVMATLSVGATF